MPIPVINAQLCPHSKIARAPFWLFWRRRSTAGGGSTTAWRLATCVNSRHCATKINSIYPDFATQIGSNWCDRTTGCESIHSILKLMGGYCQRAEVVPDLSRRSVCRRWMSVVNEWAAPRLSTDVHRIAAQRRHPRPVHTENGLRIEVAAAFRSLRGSNIANYLRVRIFPSPPYVFKAWDLNR